MRKDKSSKVKLLTRKSDGMKESIDIDTVYDFKGNVPPYAIAPFKKATEKLMDDDEELLTGLKTYKYKDTTVKLNSTENDDDEINNALNMAVV